MAVEEQMLVGGAAEARTWIAEAELPGATRRSLTTFVDRFAQLSFARYTPDWLSWSQGAEGVQLPDWLQQLWQVLGRVHHGEIVFVQLAGFGGWSPRADGVRTSWYSWPQPGFNNDDDRAMLAPAGLMPICQQMAEQSVLAIRTTPGDRRVYELHLQDAWEDHFDNGGLPADYGRPVFDGYLRLIDNVRAVRLPETDRVVEAAV